jgi:TRAP transporter TAXI family solute receptor
MRRFILIVFALFTMAGAMTGAAAGAAAQSVEALRNRVNQGTVAIISGGVNGTYIRIASDLAAVLDKGDELRILPVIGKGSVQNITDLLYLRGIDVAIVQSDVLGYIRKERLHPNLEQRIRYITKLYNEEVHILAGRDVHKIQDLAGRKVNLDIVGSGTAMTASTLFDALDMSVEATHFDQALALEKVKSGEIAAMVYVAGKPTELFRKIDPGSGVHFLSVPLNEQLLQIYLPSVLTHDDYPGLVAEDTPLDTVAVGAVMAVYNWEPNTDRFRRVDAFVQSFFNNFSAFLKPPRHPKWQDVNLAATLPGWTRFSTAEDWLQRLARSGGTDTTGAAAADPALKASFDEFARFLNDTRGAGEPALGGQSREAMFARFLEWRRQQEAAPAAASPSAPSR